MEQIHNTSTVLCTISKITHTYFCRNRDICTSCQELQILHMEHGRQEKQIGPGGDVIFFCTFFFLKV